MKRVMVLFFVSMVLGHTLQAQNSGDKADLIMGFPRFDVEKGAEIVKEKLSNYPDVELKAICRIEGVALFRAKPETITAITSLAEHRALGIPVVVKSGTEAELRELCGDGFKLVE